MKGLNEFSKSYYQECNYYEKFSQAEDRLNLILDFLKTVTQNKNVLDIGCGTGKYTSALVDNAKSIIGIDKSSSQLEIAKTKVSSNNFICCDASNLPFQNSFFDVIISCWCVGTIQNTDIQKKVVSEIKRVLKNGGSAYFVENDIGGEFEQIRDRYPNIERTKKYNNFLEENGFVECKKIQTFFEFETLDEAKNTFERIWDKNVANKIKSNKICHNVIIYQFVKKI